MEKGSGLQISQKRGKQASAETLERGGKLDRLKWTMGMKKVWEGLKVSIGKGGRHKRGKNVCVSDFSSRLGRQTSKVSTKRKNLQKGKHISFSALHEGKRKNPFTEQS